MDHGIVSATLYLAGPGVFRPDAPAHGAALKALCAAHGGCGLFPMDNEDPPGSGDLPDRIRTANMAMIRACDAVVADMAPFRGPSMDPGTAYEMGAAAALGKIVVGYNAAARPYAERVAGRRIDNDGSWRDAAGLAIERFHDPATGRPIPLADNLMMARGVDAMAAGADEAIALAVTLVRRRGAEVAG